MRIILELLKMVITRGVVLIALGRVEMSMLDYNQVLCLRVHNYRVLLSFVFFYVVHRIYLVNSSEIISQFCNLYFDLCSEIFLIIIVIFLKIYRMFSH
jgi:hypothetical protein